MTNIDEWIDDVIERDLATHLLQNGRYELRVQCPLITVRNVATGALEAYSSTRADFNLSLSEFAHDFFDEK